MKRGDLVIVAAPGDYGKPRPAVIILRNAIVDDHPSISFCQFTTTINASLAFRVTIEPSAENGLKLPSQIMADKPLTVLRHRVGPIIGRLSELDILRLNGALAFVLGLSD
jgi:mRNA interferase MazF